MTRASISTCGGTRSTCCSTAREGALPLDSPRATSSTRRPGHVAHERVPARAARRAAGARPGRAFEDVPVRALDWPLVAELSKELEKKLGQASGATRRRPS